MNLKILQAILEFLDSEVKVLKIQAIGLKKTKQKT